MKNRIAFVYMLIVIFLVFAFSFSFFIEARQESKLEAKQTQQVEKTLTAGAEQFYIQLTALAERTPEP